MWGALQVVLFILAILVIVFYNVREGFEVVEAPVSAGPVSAEPAPAPPVETPIASLDFIQRLYAAGPVTAPPVEVAPIASLDFIQQLLSGSPAPAPPVEVAPIASLDFIQQLLSGSPAPALVAAPPMEVAPIIAPAPSTEVAPVGTLDSILQFLSGSPAPAPSVDVAPVPSLSMDVAPMDVAPMDVAPMDVAPMDVAPVLAPVDVAPVESTQPLFAPAPTTVMPRIIASLGPAPTPAPIPMPLVTLSSGPAPAPVSYTNLSPYDLRIRQEQTSALKNLSSDYSVFKPVTENRLTTTENNMNSVIRNVHALNSSELVNEARLKNLQMAMPGWQALLEPGYVSSPGLVRPSDAGSERPTYPDAASLNQTTLEKYIHDLIASMIKHGSNISGP